MRHIKKFESFKDYRGHTKLYDYIDEAGLLNDFSDWLYLELNKINKTKPPVGLTQLQDEFIEIITDHLSAYFADNEENVILNMIERHPDVAINLKDWLVKNMKKLPDWIERGGKTGLLNLER